MHLATDQRGNLLVRPDSTVANGHSAIATIRASADYPAALRKIAEQLLLRADTIEDRELRSDNARTMPAYVPPARGSASGLMARRSAS